MAVAGTEDLHNVGYAAACSRRGDWEFQTFDESPAWQQMVGVHFPETMSQTK